MTVKPTAILLALTALATLGADRPPDGRREAQAALKPFGGLVGDWRGAGQPRRGSSSGAWTETAAWAWKLTPETASLDLTVTGGKLLKSARLRPADKPGSFALDAILTDGSRRSFAGKVVGKQPLVLVAEPPEGAGPARITLNPLHDTRLLMLFEARNEGGGFRRLAEVGYTRQGVAFAAGESYPLCIVTEGRGTTQVTYKGKTYWVCCSGCKDLFNEDPEAVLVEAAEKAKAKGGR